MSRLPPVKIPSNAAKLPQVPFPWDKMPSYTFPPPKIDSQEQLIPAINNRNQELECPPTNSQKRKPRLFRSKRKRKYNRTWKRNEIKSLFEITQQYCKSNKIQLKDLTEDHFQEISQNLDQTAQQCMHKVQEIVKSGTLRPGAWSSDEDEILTALIRQQYQKWGRIANEINRQYYNGLKIRSGKQCKERWNNHLNPEINRSPWTLQEELILLKQHRKVGNKWSVIALRLDNRTESSVKNKIKSLVNKGQMELYTVNNAKKVLDLLILQKQEEIRQLNDRNILNSDEIELL